MPARIDLRGARKDTISSYAHMNRGNETQLSKMRKKQKKMLHIVDFLDHRSSSL
jgi:hypothetical protein